MIRLRNNILILAVGLLLSLPGVAALADYVYTDSNGPHTVFSFLCQTTKLCTGFVIMDSTGTYPAAVKPALTAPVANDPALVVGLSPNTGEVGTPASGVSQPSGGVGISGWLSGIYNKLSGAISVTGTFWQAIQPVSQSGTWAITQSGTWTVNPLTIGNWGLAASTQNGSPPTNAQLGMGQFNSAPTTIGSGNVSPLQMDSAGNLLVNLKAGAGASVTAASSGAITNPTSTLTLPSTTAAYTAGQLIANSATAGSVVNPSFAIANSAGGAMVSRLRLTTNDTTSTAWGAQTIRVDLWSTTPTWTNGDRGAWSPATQTAAHLGSFTCTVSAEYGDGAFSECAPAVGNAAVIHLASGTSVFWSLQAVSGSGVTGASKVFTLTAELLN
jgi:hypothetical protein